MLGMPIIKRPIEAPGRVEDIRYWADRLKCFQGINFSRPGTGYRQDPKEEGNLSRVTAGQLYITRPAGHTSWQCDYYYPAVYVATPFTGWVQLIPGMYQRGKSCMPVAECNSHYLKRTGRSIFESDTERLFEEFAFRCIKREGTSFEY